MFSYLTKAFTNALIYRAIEDGELALTTCVSDVIPEFSGGLRQTITFYHLLTHSSGLPPFSLRGRACNGSPPGNHRSHLSICPFEALPGEKVITRRWSRTPSWARPSGDGFGSGRTDRSSTIDLIRSR